MTNTNTTKEPLLKSERFRVLISTIVLEILLFALPLVGIEIDLEVLRTLAGIIGGLAAAFILGRSYRNS